ncbi:MAG: hypothetical protein COW65_16525 [Cytophagales bacterium CG18_big_fil_WC_8_21_14_2_50_42_9]|nr:MAG: hypothetical protein COW65_16525 [Cytophagales bacterium CG18_big_fil_WC_8_21_14_2_50_42_9]
MSSLADKGLKISQNVFFKVLTQRATKLIGKPAKIGFLLRDAYQKLIDEKSDKTGFVQVRDIMFSFIRLVRSYFRGEYRAISTKSIVIGIATLLYVVSPIDLVPDFIPIIGFADDISLMAWFIKAFQTELLKFREWEQAQGIMPT